MTVFNNSVTALDNEDPMTEVCKIWTEIGTSHARRKISRKSFEVKSNIFYSLFKDINNCFFFKGIERNNISSFNRRM